MEANLSALETSAWSPIGVANWFERCAYNLDSGVDVSRWRIFAVPDCSDKGVNVLTFRLLGGCDCGLFVGEMRLF